MVESFWAIPDVTDIRTPLSILREQATALTEQTKGVLVGAVDVRKGTDDAMIIDLGVSVPALNDYRYRIFTYIQHIGLYPGQIRSKDSEYDKRIIDNEGEFISLIKDVLSSEKIRNVLVSLLSQTGAV